MEKSRITKKDRDIFSSLFLARRPLPLKKLALKSDMSWKTANEHVTKLSKLGIVNINRTPRRTNVFLNPKLINTLKKQKKSGGTW